jgi:acylphosphatase
MSAAPLDHPSTIRVIYTGHVQGVNFRWTTHEIAVSFPVTGFVRNLADGTVELVARGPLHSVRDFLDAVATRFHNHITHADESPCVVDEEFESFEICH